MRALFCIQCGDIITYILRPSRIYERDKSGVEKVMKLTCYSNACLFMHTSLFSIVCTESFDVLSQSENKNGYKDFFYSAPQKNYLKKTSSQKASEA